jgi:hypothetical protein
LFIGQGRKSCMAWARVSRRCSSSSKAVRMAFLAHTVIHSSGTGRAGAPGMRSRNQTSSAQCGNIRVYAQ